MSDIKSGSENVKNVFRRTMSRRTFTWLSKQKFSNKELVEIYELSDKIEHHSDKRHFYAQLMITQKGPFNSEVFNTYKDDIFHVDGLIALLEYSQGVSDEDKKIWIDYAILTNSYWFIPNYFSNGRSAKFGIDIKKSPFNLQFASAVVKYRHKMSRGAIPEEVKDLMWGVLDTMTDNEKHKWYLSDVAHTYVQSVVSLLAQYPNTPSITLEHYYNRLDEYDIINRGHIATHPNSPPQLRAEMYEKTGDDKFLPQEVQDIFLF